MTFIKYSKIACAVAFACTLGACNLAAVSDTTTDARQAPTVSADKQNPAMDQFINELMAKMTIEEKVGQLNLLSSDWDKTGPSMSADYQQQIKAGKVGSVFNAYTADFTRTLQKVAVEQTRLGIPLLFGYDVIHGHRTIFPISLGEAASWDPAAVKTSARIAAAEASAEGLHWTFAPMLDISRDPRWGRISEGSGEDVFLSSVLAKARVLGFQGDDLYATDTLLACAKHYAAYGQSQAGRDYHSTDMSERELWETYLPPFKATVDAGVGSFMTAFNDLNGVPATANNYLIQDILKQRWGFDGFVVTDYTSINELVPHGLAEDLSHAAQLAINAGVDMDMQGSVYSDYLPELLSQGKVTEQQIDQAVRRILQMKYKLGLFEDPYRYSDNTRQQQQVYKAEYLEAARDVARKSFVLLKNDNKVLPLNAGQSIALIGPLADSKTDMIGSWSAAGDRYTKPVTLREGLQQRLGADAKIYYAKGAGYEFNDTDQSGFAKAIAAAKKADVILLAMGEKWDMTGEAASRVELGFPGTQEALMHELKKLGKPMVLVLMSGRPMTINWANDNLDGILHTWYAGTQGGHAIADVLYGDYNPSGKLPVTFPRHVGQIPIYYNMKSTGRPYEPAGQEQKYRSRYLDSSNLPLYPFGYGLSYTSFAYSAVTLSSAQLSPEGEITASVTLTNTGDRAGEEVVQLYIQDKTGSVTRPVRELKGFEKVQLGAKESKTVQFSIKAADLAFYDLNMNYTAEAGEFNVFIGTDSTTINQASFRLADTVKLHSALVLKQSQSRVTR
ncbi:beta-glucosidase BglX [Rheinheimera hassiensis]|uniref:beta-glucosidase BglX n=1 Tax=Rheinheimera hassiensis TaxID=1193627 RepID=UPI001F066233|nr:beta-glucosidase BglX [Rheinheimera hassiensis]